MASRTIPEPRITENAQQVPVTNATADSTVKTRAPSKTRHLSAQRAAKLENAVSLYRMAAESTDDSMKQAATLLATKAMSEVFKLDDEIARLQSAS